MKKKLLWLLSIVAFSTLIQGCMTIDMNGVVNEDGTMTISARYDMSKLQKATQGFSQNNGFSRLNCEEFSKGSVKPTGCFKVSEGVFDLRWERVDGTVNHTVKVERGFFTTSYELNATSLVSNLGKSLDDNKATTKKDEFAALRTLGVVYNVTLSLPGTITPSDDLNITNNIVKLDGITILEDHKEVIIKSQSYNTPAIVAVALIGGALIIFGVYLYLKRLPLDENKEKIQKALVATIIALCLGAVAIIGYMLMKKQPTQENTNTTIETNTTELNNSTPPEQNSTAYLIEPGHVGDLSLGRRASKVSVAEPLKFVSMTKKVTFEGEESEVTYYLLSENGTPLLEAYLASDGASDTIEDITVVSHKYATVKGIKIGSTLEDLLKAYPANTISYSYISDRYTLVAEGIEFSLDPVGFKNKEFGHLTENASESVTLPSAAFQPSTKVISLRIFKGL